MEIDVLVFGPLAAGLGEDRLRVRLDPGASVATLIERLEATHPDLAPLAGRVAVAINRAYARPEDPVKAGDEVALIPPVSGG